MLRREFSVKAGMAQARLYVTALGVYEAADQRYCRLAITSWTPGWTSYNHRLRYQTFDVTSLVREGSNAIGAMLGDGWYRGRLTWNPDHRNSTATGWRCWRSWRSSTTMVPPTASSPTRQWRAATGPILSSNIYDGETYDARLERPGWSLPGYDDHDWAGVALVERDLGTLVAPSGPPVRRTETVAPVAISQLAFRPHASSTLVRTWSADCASLCMDRRARSSRCATPRCWRR